MAKPAVWIPRNLNLIQFETMLFGGSEGSMGRSPVPVLSYLQFSNYINCEYFNCYHNWYFLGGYGFARHDFKEKILVFF